MPWQAYVRLGTVLGIGVLLFSGGALAALVALWKDVKPVRGGSIMRTTDST